MNGLDYIRRIREYCDYLERHLLYVQKSWAVFQVACKNMNVIYDDFLFHTINYMIIEHDLSKMSPEEFIQYQREFFPVSSKDASGFQAACVHHYEHNPHHWQTWTKLTERFPDELSCHCVCMVVDWMAVGMQTGDTAENYYLKNRERILIPPWADRFVEEIFECLRNVTKEDLEGLK